jgi:hypothetical protein
MAADYPKLAAGRVSKETADLIQQAEETFGVTEGALVRMALDDYMPRYLANQGKPQHAELFAKLSVALDARPELEKELSQLAKNSIRRSRTAVPA